MYEIFSWRLITNFSDILMQWELKQSRKENSFNICLHKRTEFENYLKHLVNLVNKKKRKKRNIRRKTIVLITKMKATTRGYLCY